MAVDLNKLAFPKASGNCLKAMEMLGDDDVDIIALDKVITSDPILSSTIIKYANSPIHRRQSQITNVATAINILGLKNVYNALVMAIMKGYSSGNKSSEHILHHSLTISALGSFIASRTFKQTQHEMELLGIMHDLPSMVLCHNFRSEYRSLLADIRRAEQPLEAMELEIFGVRREQIIGLAMREFCLPEKIANVLIANCATTDIGPVESDEDRYLSILALAHHVEGSVVNDQYRMHDTVPGNLKVLLGNLELIDTEYSDMIDDGLDVINEHISQVA